MLLSLLAAAPVEAENPPPDIALFTAPFAVGAELALSTLVANTEPMIFIPLGANFTAADLEWTADIALVHLGSRALRPGRGGPEPSVLGLWLAMGPVIHSGTRPLHGLFFTPKLIFAAFRIGADALMLDVLLGADVGYQFTAGPFYVAFIFGVSFGVADGENDGWAGPWLGVNSLKPNKDGLNAVVGLNLQLFRLGFAF